MAQKLCENLVKGTIGCDIMTKHIYLCHVDRYIGSYDPCTGDIKYETSDKFVDFVTEILHLYPEHTPHNVRNQGIEDAIRHKIKTEEIKKLLTIKENMTK